MESYKHIPFIPLRGLVVFPNMTINLDVAREKATKAIEAAMLDNQYIFLVAQKDAKIEAPVREELHDTGTIAKIKQILKMPGDMLRIVVEGERRAILAYMVENDEYYTCAVSEEFGYIDYDPIEAEALMRVIIKEFDAFAHTSGKIPDEVLQSVQEISLPSQLADIIAASVLEKQNQRQEILDAHNPVERLEKLYGYLTEENQIVHVEQRISSRVKRQMDRSQKEYYLREQMKAIQKELGDGEESEAEELHGSVDKANLPEEVKEKAHKELDRMAKMSPGMPEISLIRSYIEWILELPWDKQTVDNLDIENARAILEEDHYGMEKVKERIIEYLAVRALTQTMKGPVLCFVGPPGVGKTSIARSIARAVGRRFVRMSLGGVRDEAEIRGHRRTYVGAIPGRILASMKQAGTVNPVFLFDEIDKMSADFRGDPASALLEVLDGEQNNTFRDHYLEVPYDLSKVMFLTTANSVESIPGPLLDRMEIIHLSSYTEMEKQQIAFRHLLPKQEKEHGIEPGTVEIEPKTMLHIINSYTREAGVRNLERQMAAVCRRSACRIVETGTKEIKISMKNVKDFLGVPKYHRDDVNKVNQVGTATGLAWTSVGGETLNIDVTIYKGNGELLLTGQLGDVMKESARTAYSIIRANAVNWGIQQELNKKQDIHIHIPEGATPKEGPSAGITLLSAMLSAFTNIPVRSDTAMTGEITLRGRVLPIGGLKEKVLAAYRAGIHRIIMPKDNEKDLEEIPETVRQQMNFIPASDMREVLENILVRMPKKKEKQSADQKCEV